MIFKRTEKKGKAKDCKIGDTEKRGKGKRISTRGEGGGAKRGKKHCKKGEKDLEKKMKLSHGSELSLIPLSPRSFSLFR